MKKNDLILLVSVLAYSFLFYKQMPGVNFFLFSIFIVIASAFFNKNILSNTQWRIAAASSLVTGFTVMLFGTPITYIANVLSLSLMSVFSVSPKSSVIFGLFYAAYSFMTAIGFMFVDMVERKPGKHKNEKSSDKIWTKLMIYIGIVLVVILFFVLYRNSNVLFYEFTKKINLDFISLPWIGFTLLGFILLYGFFYHRNLSFLYQVEEKRSDDFSKEHDEQKHDRFFGKSLSIKSEYISGLILLGLLNFMLVFLNALDVGFLWAGVKLPNGVTYAQFVHQGIGNLIISIIIAILIIMFYYRGRLNFYNKISGLKFLTYFWIIQNIFMVISTVMRNNLYIQEYSLTQKRIGVYVWLFLAIIGLSVTFIKIFKKKNNWFLFRKTGWAFFIFMVIATSVNWDQLITNYNIKKSERLDKYYLLNLGYTNIPDLLKLEKDTSDISDNYYYDWNFKNLFRSFSRREYDFQKRNFLPRLHYKMYDFLKIQQNKTWKSWVYDFHRTEKQILELDQAHKLSDIYLNKKNLETLKPIIGLKNIEKLHLADNALHDLSEFSNFQNLKYLDLQNNYLISIDSLPKLKNLQTLCLNNNSIIDFAGLSRLPALEVLKIADNGDNQEIIDQNSIPILENLVLLDISGNYIDDYSFISKFKKLQVLHAKNMRNRDLKTFPNLSGIKELDISENGVMLSSEIFFEKLSGLRNLKKLSIAQNSIYDLSVFSNVYRFRDAYEPDNPKTFFPNLEYLDATNNNIRYLEPLSLFAELKTLILSNNTIKDISSLPYLPSLQELDLSLNSISILSGIEAFSQLKKLDISHNKLENIDALIHLENLVCLKANYCGVRDVTALSNLHQIKVLEVDGNGIRDLSPLKKLTKLEILKIEDHNAMDISVFFDMKHLKELYLNDVSEQDLEKLMKELPETKIYINRRIQF